MSLAVDQFPTEPVVDYENFRSQIEHGDLLLCSGSGWFSRMIKTATQSVWSHVGFVMRLDDIGRIMVLESVEPLGVRTVPLRKYIEDYDNNGDPYSGGLVIARHADFAKPDIQGSLGQFGRFAVDLFGYPYDKGEIAKIAARIAASYLPFSDEDKKSLERDQEYICSEYVWECYKKLGINIEWDRRGFIAPADFARAQKVALRAVLKQP